MMAAIMCEIDVPSGTDMIDVIYPFDSNFCTLTICRETT